VRLALLGPVRAIVRDEPVRLPPKGRIVLATLLLRAGHVVSVPALATAIWDEDPPSAARNAIQGQVKRLRQEFGPESGRIITRSPGYLIEVRPGELDLHRFTGLRELARAAATSAAWDRSGELLREALELWDGEPLSDAPSEYLRRTEVPRLTELRDEAREARIDADLNLGRHGAVIAELRALVAEHPFRERLWEQLMLGLYRAGRQSDALAAYTEASRTLSTELGIDPSPRLRQLHGQILAADPALDLNGVALTSQNKTTRRLRGVIPQQLPADLADFTGRTAEAGRLHDFLVTRPGRQPGSMAVAAITGPGGVGKTALAVHVAHQAAAHFPDGQLFIVLGGATSPLPPADVLGRLLRDFGVPDAKIPAAEYERAARYRTLMADRTMLIVLDDAHSAAQVRPLLPGSGRSAVVVTSRATLADLAGATFTALPVLDADESRTLFAGIAGDQLATSDPVGTDAVVVACAGLPLAIRIAGSRLATQPSWTAGQLGELLASEQRRLGELAVGDTAVRASFEVSYLALPTGRPDPARVFRMFGLAGLPALSGSALAALADVPAAEAAAAVTLLLDAHLLVSPEPGRFSTHDLLRLYAVERSRLDETAEARQDALRRLFAWYLHALTACEQPFSGVRRTLHISLAPLPAQLQAPDIRTRADAQQWLRAEQANLPRIVNLARDHEMPDCCWQLAWLLRYFLDWSGRWSDDLAVAETGVAAARACGNQEAVAALLNVLGAAEWRLGHQEAAEEHLGQALAIRHQLGDQRAEAETLSNLSVAELRSGKAVSATGRLVRALALYRAIGDVYGEASCLHSLGSACQATERAHEALAYFQQALVLRTRHAPPLEQAATLHSIGGLLLATGQPHEGLRHLQQGLTICEDNELPFGAGMTLASLGDGYQALDRTAEARRAWQRAYEILTELGAPEATGVGDRLAGSANG
jgi:DNA-binding SARP family transcriptional activator